MFCQPSPNSDSKATAHDDPACWCQHPVDPYVQPSAVVGGNRVPDGTPFENHRLVGALPDRLLMPAPEPGLGGGRGRLRSQLHTNDEESADRHRYEHACPTRHEQGERGAPDDEERHHQDLALRGRCSPAENDAGQEPD